MRNKNLNININDISETAFLTLQCHAIDAQSKSPILNDRGSLKTLKTLKEYFQKSGSALHKKLFDDKVQKRLVMYIVLRAKKYDSCIKSFIEKYPNAAVVNIGCGLDHRFERVDNGGIHFYDLDLPDIMNIKKQLFPEQDCYHQISQSVFDLDWIDQIEAEQVILAAEGVFMYCEESDVKQLFRTLQGKLNNPEIVFEAFNSKWLSGWRRKTMEIKLKKSLKLGEDTTFKFGISDSDEIESWDPGYKLLDDWSYIDSKEFDSSIIRFFRNMDSIRKIEWTVRYQLNSID